MKLETTGANECILEIHFCFLVTQNYFITITTTKSMLFSSDAYQRRKALSFIQSQLGPL